MTVQVVYIPYNMQHPVAPDIRIDERMAGATGLHIPVDLATTAEPGPVSQTPPPSQIIYQIEARWRPYATQPGQEPMTQRLLKDRAQERAFEHDHEELRF